MFYSCTGTARRRQGWASICALGISSVSTVRKRRDMSTVLSQGKSRGWGCPGVGLSRGGTIHRVRPESTCA